MEIVITHGAGLDVHKRRIVATVLTPAVTETRTFGTLTADLLALADWLTACGVTRVAMEATGVCWKPVYNVLEAIEGLAVWVVNPQTILGMPGRKSDVQDSQWIASRLRLGAVKASVIPPRPQRELRELVRYRQSLVRERAAEANRIPKILEGANIKRASVISDILGKSGTRILQALAAGETDPAALARLADARIRAPHEILAAALQGLVRAHQQQLLRWPRQHVAFLDQQIAAVSTELAARLTNVDDALLRLQTIPGVGRRTAEIIIAECGADLQRFPTAAAFVSWAGFSPGQHESGGQAHPAPIRKGSPVLRSALVEAAQAAAKTDTYLAAVFRRLAARRGKQRALITVGRHMLQAAYHILRGADTVYHDLGPHDFDERDRQAVLRRAMRRLETLGYRVTVEPLVPEAS